LPFDFKYTLAPLKKHLLFRRRSPRFGLMLKPGAMRNPPGVPPFKKMIPREYPGIYGSLTLPTSSISLMS
jgi:hypothetical protein